MERISRTPREGWQRIVESQGLHYHSVTDEAPGDGAPGAYWDESAYYQFSAAEIDALEACTVALNEHCLAAAQHIIDRNLLERVGIPASHHDWVRRSWERDEHTIYGRFDLAFDGKNPPKLLEYNADTPTALLEAAVVQWYWLKDVGDPREVDQFNSIHERLLEIFGILKKRFHGKFYFAAMEDSLEDFMTVNYLRDVAMQAGWDTEFLHAAEIGWQPEWQQFTDLAEKPIEICFKLYPWEWMLREEFGTHLLRNTTKWWEPPWKMLLSTKGLLPILYELFPDSPYVLPASFESMPGRMHVRKPLHGREGANVAIIDENGKEVLATPGPYEGPYVCQQFFPLPKFAGRCPVIGSWMVNGHACGIGIREDAGFVTTNRSRFVPHLFHKRPADIMNEPRTSKWNWPPLLLYFFVFFFLAILCGSQGIPGVYVLVPGLAFGVWAAWSGWFEMEEKKGRGVTGAKSVVEVNRTTMAKKVVMRVDVPSREN